MALYFKSPNNKYFIGQLRTLQKESYGKYIQIAIGNDTRWNSHYECFRTLVKSKGALRVFIFIFYLIIVVLILKTKYILNIYHIYFLIRL